MRRENYVSLLLGLAALAGLALVASPRTSRAQQDPPAAPEAQAKEASATTTKPAGCETCSMAMRHLEVMAKLKQLLTEAKASAGTEAKDTVAKIDEALTLLEQHHLKMHEQMAHHMQRMHKGMMHPGAGKMAEMKCPMCGKMMAPQAKVVNGVCPITGNKIDPYTVPDDLTREFQGKKVGFCCPACPPAWDKLTDQEKQAKLDQAIKASEKPAEPGAGMEHPMH
jgi:hypothetical protein